jgi:hypothetical protein
MPAAYTLWLVFPMQLTLLARLVALCAGGLDFLSGLGFLAVPAPVFRVMGLQSPPADALPYVRLMGVLVASIGAGYLWAFVCPEARLRTVFGFTLFPRLGTGLFTCFALILGVLPPVWLGVGLVDFSLVLLQGWLLAKGIYRHE